MITYRFAGRKIAFSGPLPEIQWLHTANSDESAVPLVASRPQTRISYTRGWVAEDQRLVEVWTAGAGRVLRVEGFRDFYLTPDGGAILPVEGAPELTEGERQVILGPGLTLALALRGVWVLHAGAAIHDGHTILFLGESGEGKSTLAAHLIQQPDWQGLADDTLPVTLEPDGLCLWPQFPQLKLSPEKQPGIGLPERLPLERVCLLERGRRVELTQLSSVQALQAWLSHTAGTRMFDAELLRQHLQFCGRAAELLPVFRLAYPRRWSALPKITNILEGL